MKITLKDIRTLHGYSTQKMAEILGISPKIYEFYEKHPHFIPADVAIKISVVGHISLDYIFFG